MTHVPILLKKISYTKPTSNNRGGWVWMVVGVSCRWSQRMLVWKRLYWRLTHPVLSLPFLSPSLFSHFSLLSLSAVGIHTLDIVSRLLLFWCNKIILFQFYRFIDKTVSITLKLNVTEHSQTSRLLTSSLSLGVPVPRVTRCIRDV
jgi:hypothetical protein